MCGIAGFCNYNHDYNNEKEYWTNVLISMRKSMKHRGNEETGDYLSQNYGFSHTRLCIRDLNTGRQPIIRIRDSKEYAITYNGEIYNSDEIKLDLIKKGYIFETESDTEVILYSYMEYGEDSVKNLNGVFSYAIWDGSKNTILLFRDRCGTKPLFYSIQNNELVFASELKALFNFPNLTPEIDINSLREIIGIGPARTAGIGVFKGINEIKPGHFAKYNLDGFKEIQYWDFVSKPHKENYEETVEHTGILVRNAVERQMVSDVDVCSFLSGGVDSSIITAIASNYLEKKGKVLNTFSFDFTENDIYFKSNSFQPERDKPYVDIMLKHYNTNHSFLECDELELFNYLFNAVDAKDLPGMADVDASILYFCSKVKEFNKVALTGECADEIFGGYPWFHRKELLESNTFPWTRNLEPRKSFLNEDILKKLDIDAYVKNRYDESLKKVPYLDGESGDDKRRREISYMNIKWFMTTLLDRMDRTSMYTALEARVPFADNEILDYLWNVPWKFKCPGGVVKGLLRDSCKDLLPEQLLYRKKSPYPKTYNPKYEKLLSDNLMSIINKNDSPILGLIDKNKITKFLETPSDYGKPWFGQLMAGPQLIAYYIQLNYWLEKFNLNI